MHMTFTLAVLGTGTAFAFVLGAAPAGAQQPAAPPVAAPIAPASPSPAPAGPTPRAGRAVAERAPADSVTLALGEAVERAQRTGDEARLAEAQIDATEASVTTARASALPQLRLQGAYTHVLENARAQIVGSVFAQNYNYNLNANLQQPLFQGGRAIGALRAAGSARAAARQDAEEARAQVTVDVQRAYLAALANDELVAIQQRNLELSDARVTQAEQLERAGRAARYDVLRARVERANLEPLLIQARNDRAIARLELARLANLPPGRPLRLTSRIGGDTATVLAVLRAAETLAAAPPRRAAVSAAENVVAARAAGVRVARADFLPTLSAFAQFGYLALPTSNRFPTRPGETSTALCPPGSAAGRVCQNNGFFGDRQIGLQLAWPLFDGLRAKGNLDQAAAQERIAEVQLAQTRERVALEAERARAEVERARALYAAQQQNVREAEEAFRLAELRQQRGLGTTLEVSDAQLALLTARTNALRSTFDVYAAAAELARALGRPIPLADQTP
jgi:HAE1 family hydrophobic/amphiphilic exporter-1